MNRIRQFGRGRHRQCAATAADCLPATPSVSQWPEERSPRADVPALAIRSLLVPLDGSPLSEQALPYALSIARRSGALVVLAHVFSAAESIRDPWRLFHTDEEETLKASKQAYLRELLQRLEPHTNAGLAATLIEDRFVADALRQAASGVDLVVMSARRRTPWRQLSDGCLIDSLLDSCPVLLVPGSDEPVNLSHDPQIKQMVVALNGSEFAEQILPPAAALGAIYQSQATLVRVRCLASRRSDAAAYLADATRRLQSRLVDVAPYMVTSDRPVHASLAAFASDHGADAIAMATNWTTGLRRLVHGSVAERLVRKARTPVLLHRPAVAEIKTRPATRSFAAM